MEDKEAAARLSADYPDWVIFWRRGLAHAWLPPVPSPPHVLEDATYDGLRLRVAEYERVLRETHSAMRALAAAEALET